MRHIDQFITQYKVSDFVFWAKSETLELSPSFQRRSVWKPGTKSYLIDTIVQGLPIPIIILRDRKTDLDTIETIREVVDGQQRLRTLLSFIKPTYLKDYDPSKDDFLIQEEHNKEMAGSRYDELSPNLKQTILGYQFSVHVLPVDVDDREVVEIFRRLNSTGYKLNSQEIRNSEYFGKFRMLMNRIASDYLKFWREWKIFNENDIARMQEVDLTSELAQFMLKGIIGKNQKSIDILYKDKNESFAEYNEISRRFRIVFETIDEAVGRKIHILPYRRRTLFYSLFTYIYDIQFGIGSNLKLIKPKPVSKEIAKKIVRKGEKIKNKDAPEVVLESLARRTTHPSSRNEVLIFLRGN